MRQAAIGAWGGRPILERWGRYLAISAEDLDTTEAFVAKYGTAAAFFGRMIPVVRSLVSFTAGIGRMPLMSALTDDTLRSTKLSPRERWMHARA